MKKFENRKTEMTEVLKGNAPGADDVIKNLGYADLALISLSRTPNQGWDKGHNEVKSKIR